MILITSFATTVCLFILILAVVKGVELMSGVTESSIIFNKENNSFSISNPSLKLLADLSILSLLFIVSIFMIKLFQNRSFSEIINGTKKVRWSRSFYGFSIWFLICILVYGIIGYFLNPEKYILQFEIMSFIPLFLIVIIMVPIQSIGEEFIYRGYLGQGFAGWTKSRWMTWILPSILFGLMHFGGTDGTINFTLIMFGHLVFGLTMGLISILDDGIELPMGIHAANNIFVFLFSTSGLTPTSAIFYVKDNTATLWGILLCIVLNIVLILFFARKYKWDFKILNNKVIKENVAKNKS